MNRLLRFLILTSFAAGTCSALVWPLAPRSVVLLTGASLDARPNPVAPSLGPGQTVLSWSTGTGQVGRLYVVADGREVLVAQGPEGSAEYQSIPDGPSGSATAFRLYGPAPPASPLAELSVTRDDDRFSVARSALALSLYCAVLLMGLVALDGRQQQNSRAAMTTVLGSVIVGIVTTAVVFRPGAMSPDSLFQFQQASSGVITMEFPPIMSFVWSYTHRIIPGPAGMMLFHAILFWGGLGLIASACTSSPLAGALCVLGIGFFPPVFALLGVVWKDVGLGAALTLFVGMVLLGNARRSMWLLGLSIAPLFYGSSVRLNAAPAILPLAWWLWASVAEARRTPAPLFRSGVAGSVLMTFAIIVTGSVANRAMLTGEFEIPDVALQGSLLHDLAGISVGAGELTLPRYLHRPEMSLDLFQKWYDPGDGGNGFLYRYDFIFATTKENYTELTRTWWEAVKTHPMAYLRHRIGVLRTILQIRGIYAPYHRGIDPNEFGLAFPPRPLYESVTHGLDRMTPLLFRSWFFLIAAIGVVWYGRSVHELAPIAIVSSGLLYVLPYVVVSGGSDFRYVWWLVLATLFGLVVLTKVSTKGDVVVEPA